MLAELSRREKEANIKPDPDVDIFMKVRILHLMQNGIAFSVKFVFVIICEFFMLFMAIGSCRQELSKAKKQV